VNGPAEREEGTQLAASHAWQGPVLAAALLLGLVLMAVQLWILTVALDLYLGGLEASLWPLAGASGAVFLGGLLVLRLLRAPPGARTPAR
jgi:hypothetical protein